MPVGGGEGGRGGRGGGGSDGGPPDGGGGSVGGAGAVVGSGGAAADAFFAAFFLPFRGVDFFAMVRPGTIQRTTTSVTTRHSGGNGDIRPRHSPELHNNRRPATVRRLLRHCAPSIPQVHLRCHPNRR